MLDQIKLIKDINKSSSIYFTESTFILHPSTANRFKITGNNSSKALNNYNNASEEVTVIKWFDFFWIYIDLRFENQNTFISISVFQGNPDDNIKHQLFRAEWDDYNNAEEKHPQPHWHITSNQIIEKTFEELAKLDETESFVSLLQEEKSKIVDINKIHFAMNGNWINNDSHVHSLNNHEHITKWFTGLFAHLKTQLEYVK